ncbi:MAG: hypothetical protein OEL88_16605 [Sterolibacteriaceae bacterium MAG5]|nr:hypothetical protein [Candidatus Nitricoxidireducens bremensis]
MRFKFAFFAVLVALVSSLWAIDGAFAADDDVARLSLQAGDVSGSGQPVGDLDRDGPVEVEEFAHIALPQAPDCISSTARSPYRRERPREVVLPTPLRPPSRG